MIVKFLKNSFKKELFSDIGPIKRARLLNNGIAEVVYVKLEDARKAISKYNKNELDGQQMWIELINDDVNKTNMQPSQNGTMSIFFRPNMHSNYALSPSHSLQNQEW